MAQTPVNKRYTDAATDDVVFTNDRAFPCEVAGIYVAAANSNTLSPDVRLKSNSVVIADHPGVPAGGGLVSSACIEVPPGKSVTVSTTDPGGTLAVTFYINWKLA